MKLSPIFNPPTQKHVRPARVDLRIIFIWGLSIWIVVFAIISIIIFGFHIRTNFLIIWFYTCIFGIGLGVLLLIWEYFTRSEYMKLAELPLSESKTGLKVDLAEDPFNTSNTSNTAKNKKSAGDTKSIKNLDFVVSIKSAETMESARTMESRAKSAGSAKV